MSGAKVFSVFAPYLCFLRFQGERTLIFFTRGTPRTAAWRGCLISVISLSEWMNMNRFTEAKEALSYTDRGANVRDVIRQMAQMGGFNIIITGDVSGVVDMELRDVPWDQALAIVLAESGLGAFVEGNVVKISSLESISKRRREASDTAQLVEKTEKITSEQFFVNYATARDIAAGVKPLLTKRGRISVDERTSSVTVLETPFNIARVARIIKSLDRPTPRILIESRIVQAGTDFSRDLGIQWGTRYRSRNTGARFPATSGTASLLTCPPQ